MKKLGDYFQQVDLKKLGNKPSFATYDRWRTKVEAGLKTVGATPPKNLAPESVENLSLVYL